MKQKPRLLDLRKHIGQVQELGAKLQIKKGLASLSAHRSGSILVYTLIVMMIMLATALSIFAVAVREKKSAGTTAASMQAFAVADSGSEIALQAADRGTAINSLPGATSCNSTTGTVTISVAGGIADITFYSDETATTALECGASAGSAQKVKSVGRYGGTARAVEVAVAGTTCENGAVTKIVASGGTAAFASSDATKIKAFEDDAANKGILYAIKCKVVSGGSIYTYYSLVGVSAGAQSRRYSNGTFELFTAGTNAVVCSTNVGKCQYGASASDCNAGWEVIGLCN